MNIFAIMTIAIISSFTMTILLAPLVKRLMRKLHANQEILEYVSNHKDKAGTPTMGGLMFLIPITIVTLVMGGVHSKVTIVSLCTMLSFGLLGFLDDFIKVKYRHNQGLRAYQKIIGQVGIAVIVAVYAYLSEEIGSEIELPFTDKVVDFGYFYIPFTIFVLLATTNSVNLTDGIDGLAGSTTIVYVLTFIVIMLSDVANIEGDVVATTTNNANIVYLATIFGGLLAFLIHNTNKASIFMGDTGSLALGGMVGAVAIFSRKTLYIPLLGIMYLVSSISVIIQVLYFKITKGKRIFLMAPFHHHLQYRGLSESKIVMIYVAITTLFSFFILVSII